MGKLPKKLQCDDASHKMWKSVSQSGVIFELCQRCGVTKVTDPNKKTEYKRDPYLDAVLGRKD